MRRALVPVLATVALALTACDRTDHDFGDRGEVRLGIQPTDVAPVPGGEAVQELLVSGTELDSGRAMVSHVDVGGRTLRSAVLPAGFRPHAVLTGAVSSWSEPRDPDLTFFVAGTDERLRLRVVKLRTDLGVDTTYGEGGWVTTTAESTEKPHVHATDDGHVTVVVTSGSTSTRVILTPTGEIQSSDSLTVPAGVALHDLEPGPNGSTIGVGTLVTATAVGSRGVTFTTASDVAVVRIDPSWRLDPAFGGGDGLATVAVNELDGGRTVAVRPDGRLVVAGTTGRFEDHHLLLAGLLADGAPDGGFGLYGLTIVDESAMPDMTLVQGGPGFVLATTSSNPSWSVRTVGFKTNGVLEDTWGDHGDQRNLSASWGSVADAVIRPIDCIHGVCRGGERLLVAASTSDAPGGALVALKP